MYYKLFVYVTTNNFYVKSYLPVTGQKDPFTLGI